MLILAIATAGLYLFAHRRSSTPSFTANRYSDALDWCDTTTEDDTLFVSCKALLYGITTSTDGASCFEMQVIVSNNKELKDLTICESNDTLAYSNSVLSYKKLMPVEAVITYKQEGILGTYAFRSVAFSKIDEEYTQNIVNQDIAKLVAIDPSITTIQNSVDFCPSPKLLSDYISEENKIKYETFYNDNIMDPVSYETGSLYSLDDSEVRLLFTCDSMDAAEYLDANKCRPINIPLTTNILDSIKSSPSKPKLGEDLSEHEQYLLKEASLLYDSTEYVNFNNNSDVLNSLLLGMNSAGDLNEGTYCGIYKLLKKMNLKEFDSYIGEIEDIIYAEIPSSPFCQNTTSTSLVDRNGLYVRNSYSYKEKNFEILNMCSNLKFMLSN